MRTTSHLILSWLAWSSIKAQELDNGFTASRSSSYWRWRSHCWRALLGERPGGCCRRCRISIDQELW
uniref:Uncharacterized protein n=1 Tax=uncultured marine virus TaxID=186617 RepID=A0A0F7L875_9VIRU|nr:hypothetical protein [uncultured marine virus]